jgi:DNA-binding PadR family transcriptional regulator
MKRGHHRNRIGIPRGLLHHIALILLKSGPMSGSELTEKIEEYTEWRPSPGSMYPLLSNLQEREMIEPYEDGNAGIKRFTLTEKGKEGIEAHGHHEEEFRKRNRNIRKMYWRLLKNMPENVYDSFGGLIDTLDSTWNTMDESDVTQFKEILDNTKAELNKIGNKQDE